VAAFEVGEFAYCALGRGFEPEDALGVTQEHLACFRQAHPSRQAIEQRNAQPALERPQFTRDRRLRGVQELRSGIDAASLGHAMKDRKVP
jgi:hypothetical protein